MIRNRKPEMSKKEKVSKSRNIHYSMARRTESLLDPEGHWRIPHKLNDTTVRATSIKEHVTCEQCLKVLNEK